MAYYKLARSQSSNLNVDSVIYDRDPDTGEPLSISVTEASELTDEQAEKLQSQGYALVEAEAPKTSEVAQPVGADVAGMSPVIKQSVTPAGERYSEIDQPGQQQVDAEAQAGEMQGSDYDQHDEVH